MHLQNFAKKHNRTGGINGKNGDVIKVLGSSFFKCTKRAKKVVSESPGLVDFIIGLVNSVFNLPDGQVMLFEEFE